MLLGEYEYKVDSKGRLPLPIKFRQEFTNGLTLNRGPENCIVVYRTADFEKIANALTSQTITKSKMRRLNRFFFGNAFNMTLDGQGRIVLPPSLRKYAQINDVATIVGSNNRIELWNPDLWNAEKLEAEEQAWQIIESLEEQQ